MRTFDYIAVATVAEACDQLAGQGPAASILAGGTDLLIEWRRPGSSRPQVVLDISAVPELGGMVETDGAISIRPLTTHAQLLRSTLVRDFASLLGAAAATIGSPQVRNRGTVGGNIMNAAACADTIPPLIALGATVRLQAKSGARELGLADLFTKPYQTRARPDELLTAVQFKKLPPNAPSAFIKLGRRNALSISRLSVAAILEIGSDGRITEARIVPGAAFPTWKRVTAAEQMLLGEKPGEKLFAAAGRRVSEEMIKETGRRWSTEYKEPVLAVLVRRALEQCARQGVAQPSRPRIAAASRRQAEHRAGMPGALAGGDGCATMARRTGSVAQAAKACRFSATINGRSLTLRVPAKRTLLDLLRDELGLTGTKCGCEIGECGACTVLLDGEPVNACLVLAAQVAGRQVTTVEALARDGKLHPLQESFLDHDAVHCGFCTPGMLLSAKALLDGNPRPTEAEIRTAISGNLCRCTGYQQIVKAIEQAAG